MYLEFNDPLLTTSIKDKQKSKDLKTLRQLNMEFD